MAVATFALGTDSTVEVDATSIAMGAASELGGLHSGNLDVGDVMAETTNNDDDGMTGALYGNRTLTGTLGVRLDRAGDTAQQLILTAKLAKDIALWFRIRPRVGANHYQFAFRVLIENISYQYNNGEVVGMTVSFRSNRGGAANYAASLQT